MLPQLQHSSVSPRQPWRTPPPTQVPSCRTRPPRPRPPLPRRTAGPPASPRCASRPRNTQLSSPSLTSCQPELQGRRCAEHSPHPHPHPPPPPSPKQKKKKESSKKRKIHSYLWRLSHPEFPNNIARPKFKRALDEEKRVHVCLCVCVNAFSSETTMQPTCHC